MKVSKKHLLIGLLIGILLIVIAIPTSDTRGQYEYGTEVEKRLETILEGMEGVGNATVMITTANDKTVEGIAIVAEGGGSAVIVRNITEVVEALFGVETHKIKVIRGNLSN